MRISDWSSDVCSSDLAARGVLRGFGIGIYVENDGGVPAEFADVGVEADEDGRDGAVTLRVGTQDFGMGHATMYAQVIADELGVTFERVRVVFGDTDAVARGAGSHGRSEEHTSELHSLMRISYAVFCLKK